MRSVLVLLFAATMLVPLSAEADESEPKPEVAAEATTPAPRGGAVRPMDHNLGQVHAGLTANGAHAAGRSRDVELTATSSTAAKPVRPAATPRALRRMNADKALASMNASVRACAGESTSTSATAMSLRVSVAPGGEVESTELATPGRVPAPLLACVVKAVASTRFGAPGASGASVIVPIVVPAAAPVPAKSADVPDSTKQ